MLEVWNQAQKIPSGRFYGLNFGGEVSRREILSVGRAGVRIPRVVVVERGILTFVLL